MRPALNQDTPKTLFEDPTPALQPFSSIIKADLLYAAWSQFCREYQNLNVPQLDTVAQVGLVCPNHCLACEKNVAADRSHNNQNWSQHVRGAAHQNALSKKWVDFLVVKFPEQSLAIVEKHAMLQLHQPPFCVHRFKSAQTETRYLGTEGVRLFLSSTQGDCHTAVPTTTSATSATSVNSSGQPQSVTVPGTMWNPAPPSDTQKIEWGKIKACWERLGVE